MLIKGSVSELMDLFNQVKKEPSKTKIDFIQEKEDGTGRILTILKKRNLYPRF